MQRRDAKARVGAPVTNKSGAGMCIKKRSPLVYFFKTLEKLKMAKSRKRAALKAQRKRHFKRKTVNTELKHQARKKGKANKAADLK